MEDRKTIEKAVYDYQKIKKQISSLEQEADNLKSTIMQYMEDTQTNEVITKEIIAYRAIWETQRIDLQKLRDEYPEAAKACEYVNRCYTFRTKKNKGR